jgi:hypothetical protein
MYDSICYHIFMARRLRLEVFRRLEELLCQSPNHKVAVDNLCAEFKFSRRIGYQYIERLYIRWQREAAREAPARRNHMRKCFQAIYAEAWVKENLDLALRAACVLAKHDGCDQPPAERPIDPSTVLSITFGDPEADRRWLADRESQLDAIKAPDIE